MRIFNKIVQSKNSPSNENDIWFDNKNFYIFKNGNWEAVTLDLESADKIVDIIKDIDGVYQEKLKEGKGIKISEDNTISSLIKTVNGKELYGTGNIEIESSGLKAITLDASTATTEKFPNVQYIPQTLTDDQKRIARENIGATSETSEGLNESDVLTILSNHEYITSDDLDKSLSEKNYATKDDLNSIEPDLSDYYNKAEVHELIDSVNAGDVNLTGYYTKTEIDSKGYLTDIPNEYITETELDEALNGLVIPDLAGYATESWVEGKGYLNAIPEDYALKTDIPTIPTKLSEFNNDLGFISVIPPEYVTSTELEQVLTDKGYATTDDLESVKPDLTGYATETWVENQNYITESSLETTLSDYATQDWVSTQEYSTKSEISETYVSKTELDNKNYVINSMLDEYATTEMLNEYQRVIDDLNDIRNFAYSALQEIPPEYVTQDELKAYITSTIVNKLNTNI